MTTNFNHLPTTDIAWCPGCGNFGIHNVIKKTLSDLNVDSRKVVITSGIGQAAKMPQYINTSFFNGLHGRSLTVATAIKAANPELLVFAEGGDGDMYGEGGNHFIHAVRRNNDIVHLVHNNQVYGLTKGQASPTSFKGFVTSIQTDGVHNEPMNPLAVAISLGATFVARGYSNDKDELQELLTAAIQHKGYALLDIFHPCVTFNKLNTHKWYKENTWYLNASHNPFDRDAALSMAFNTDKYPLGIIYKREGETVFHDKLEVYEHDKRPLWQRSYDAEKLNAMFEACEM